MEILERLKRRLPESHEQEELLLELVQTMTDRINIRLGVETLPSVFNSILVDSVVKMYRRLYFEGIKRESVSNLSNEFVDDVLNEYAEEINNYKLAKDIKVVKFL